MLRDLLRSVGDMGWLGCGTWGSGESMDSSRTGVILSCDPG